VDYLLKQDALFAPESKWSFHGLLDNLFSSQKRRHAKSLAGNKKVYHLQGKSIDKYPSKQIINEMVVAVEGMVNVVELHFEWRDLPLNKDTQMFLTSTRTIFDESLRKLVLQAQIIKFKELLAISNFAGLTELDFHFDYQPGKAGEQVGKVVPEAQSLMETILPFIQHRRTMLRSLSVSSSSTVDLSNFFSALPSMPSLRQFDIDLDFEKDYLSDPSGILSILIRHSHTLFHVQFRVASSSAPTHDQNPALRKRKNWESVNDRLLANPSCLNNLISLEIPYISLMKTIPLVRRSADSLTRLCLTGYFLSPNEVSVVVDLFYSRPFELQHLHLQVDQLQWSLFRFLSCRLPNLYSLVLVYHKCCGPPDEVSLALDDTLTILPLIRSLKIISTREMEFLSFKDWKLDDIGIYEGRYRPSQIEALQMSHSSFNTEYQLMQIVSRAVPSITRWKGFRQEHWSKFVGP
jgi:hypothetical protein